MTGAERESRYAQLCLEPQRHTAQSSPGAPGWHGQERGVRFWLLNCGQAALETEDQKAKIKELAIMFHSKGRRKVSGHRIKPEARIPVRMQEG